jgi:hypothetical protein
MFILGLAFSGEYAAGRGQAVTGDSAPESTGKHGRR